MLAADDTGCPRLASAACLQVKRIVNSGLIINAPVETSTRDQTDVMMGHQASYTHAAYLHRLAAGFERTRCSVAYHASVYDQQQRTNDKRNVVSRT